MARVFQLWNEAEEEIRTTLEAKYPFSDADRQMIDDMYSRMRACEEPEADV